MIKIRLHGTLEEIEETTKIIRDQFDVLSESEPYADRGKSKYYRCYMDCEVVFNTKVSSFKKNEDAEKEAERLNAERRSHNYNIDQVCGILRNKRHDRG